MAPKPKSELMRESRKRKRDNKLHDSDEFNNFLRDTLFISNTMDQRFPNHGSRNFFDGSRLAITVILVVN